MDYFAPDIPFWSRFRLVYLYFPIFSFIYLSIFTHIYPLFAPIWLYLPLIALIWPYMPYSPLHVYSSSKTAPLCKILKQSEN